MIGGRSLEVILFISDYYLWFYLAIRYTSGDCEALYSGPWTWTIDQQQASLLAEHIMWQEGRKMFIIIAKTCWIELWTDQYGPFLVICSSPGNGELASGRRSGVGLHVTSKASNFIWQEFLSVIVRHVDTRGDFALGVIPACLSANLSFNDQITKEIRHCVCFSPNYFGSY